MSLNPTETTNDNLINTRLIQPGEYQLHVFIEGTKALLPPYPDSCLINPVIYIKAFKQERILKEKPIRLSEFTTWNEHLFFVRQIPDFLTFEKEKILIKVSDYAFLGKNALIGEFEMAITPIYFAENHCLLHQWAALTNSYKENMKEIQGFVKFSVNLVGPGDQVSKLEAEIMKDHNKSEHIPVIFSPQIETKCYQIRIQLIKGENLVKMDNIGGSIDSYLLFRFGGISYKTEAIKNTTTPFWGIQIYLPFSEPCINELLEIQIFDWDMSQNDEIVGSIAFHKDQIRQKKIKGNFIWLNLYGSQLNPNSLNNARIMNSNPNLASFWKGRLLLSLDIYDNPLPKLTSTPEPIQPETLNSYKKDAVLQWKLYIEIFYGLLFPKENSEYYIQIRWADQEINSDALMAINGVWEYHTRMNLTCNFPYFNAEELPDVFIYLCTKKKRLCFIRKPANIFLHQFNANAGHFYFSPDRSMVPELKDDEAGFIKMRCVVAVAQAISDLSVGGWNQKIVEKKGGRRFLFVHAFQAQDLIPADNDGNSDAFLVVNYYGKEARTETVYDSLNPIWYDTLILEVPSFDPEDSPPIILNIFDEDDKKKTEFIGSSILSLSEGLKSNIIKLNEKEAPPPIWLPIRYSKESLCGKVLISFNLFDDTFITGNPENLFKIEPEMELFQIKIKVLGLRNLKSLGLIPVKRAFLKFDINSIKSPNERQSLNEKKFIQTLPKEPGNNPNILTILQFFTIFFRFFLVFSMK